jgi:HlyD family secretion protein
MSKHRKRTVYGSAALALAIGVLWGFSTLRGAGGEIDESRLVTVERGPMVRSVVATGKIEPITKVEIKSKANGLIEVLTVDVDAQVDEGQVLAELDKVNLNARLREARAALQAAQAALEAARASHRRSVVEAEGPDVELTRRAYERAQALSSDKLLAPSVLDEALGAYEMAQNRQRAAASQLDVARAKVAEAEATVAQSQAAVERAEEELANATIRAPIRGTVLARHVEIGSPVSSILNLGAAATPVITMGDISQVFVRGRVDETDIGRVRLGQPCRITVETFKERIFQGRVTQISPMGVEKDNVTNFEVKVSIENTAHELKAMMTANAEIVLEERPDTLIIPEAAIVYDEARQAFVDVRDPAARDGRRRSAVKLGISNGTRTEALSGVTAGDRLVLP